MLRIIVCGLYLALAVVPMPSHSAEMKSNFTTEFRKLSTLPVKTETLAAHKSTVSEFDLPKTTAAFVRIDSNQGGLRFGVFDKNKKLVAKANVEPVEIVGYIGLVTFEVPKPDTYTLFITNDSDSSVDYEVSIKYNE